MSDPYRIALALVRLLAAMNFAAGLFLIVFCVALVAFSFFNGVPELLSWWLSLVVYAVVYVVSGLGMWLLSRPIARFAVKHFAS